MSGKWRVPPWRTPPWGTSPRRVSRMSFLATWGVSRHTLVSP
ncbi:hypothetical protein A2U01_0105069, partial [Trifolium medium]|nr:hypothetical protein [Trifolium medium]